MNSSHAFFTPWVALRVTSVFAFRPRELRAAPQSIAEAGALSRDDLRRVLIAVGIALLFSSILVFSLLSLPVARLNASVAAPHAVKPAWAEIPKPFRLFALIGSEWGREGRYHAERHREGGGRRDHLSFGAFGADQPWLQLTLYRTGTEAADPAPFFVEIARRAAPAGFSVARMGQPKPLPTRFGTFEAADFTLEDKAAPTGESTRCIGFRLANPRLLHMGGFAWDAPGEPWIGPASPAPSTGSTSSRRGTIRNSAVSSLVRLATSARRAAIPGRAQKPASPRKRQTGLLSCADPRSSPETSPRAAARTASGSPCTSD